MRVAIIGAGLTGLAAAEVLRDAGLSPVILDKGRGCGGRLSTRRAEGGLLFNHGAPVVAPSDPGFRALLDRAKKAGSARDIPTEGGAVATVGTPGMSAIPKFMADGADIRQRVEVDRIESSQGGWTLAGADVDRVIVTIPAPQAARLLGRAHPLSDALAGVTMAPVLTLMLALPAGAGHVRPSPAIDSPIEWLGQSGAARDSTAPQCWVAHASADWSRHHLERDKSEIAEIMLPMVCRDLDAAVDDAIYCAGHRWRYARAEIPLGSPFLTHASTLFVGGDWALSSDADGAWGSGVAMARALLDTR